MFGWYGGYGGWGHRHWHHRCRPYRSYYGCWPCGCLWAMVMPALLAMWMMLGACTRLSW
ncbi:MAG TPA: hypothetical protein PKW05_05335 [Anaerolineae bacterium]|nr:hypothetical protein [Anaerolineae bacterium]